ncbi:MAG: hypothetical protein Q8859_11015 [Bacteroidota bacterium]|nr:hypothetical protein [Bacteroidota bacterium]
MNKEKIILNATLFLFILSALEGIFGADALIPIKGSTIRVIMDVGVLLTGLYAIDYRNPFNDLTIMILSFMALSVFSFLLNFGQLSFIGFLNGLREFLSYFFFPVIFIFLFRSEQKDLLVKSFNRLITAFLILQIPVSVYQLILNGAGDSVSGTLAVGFSGILTFIIYLSTFYLMVQGFDRNRIFKSLLHKSYLFLFWIPSFINETKISFLLIILFFLFLAEFSGKNSLQASLLIVCLFISIHLFDRMYQRTTGFDFKTDILTSEYLETYTSDDDEIYVDVPRFGKIMLVPKVLNEEEMLLGKGPGQFKGGTVLEASSFAKEYEWLLVGSRPMLFFLLIQVGIFGTILFILYWIRLILASWKFSTFEYSKNILLFITLSFIIIQFYNDSFRAIFPTCIMMYLIAFSRYYDYEKKDIDY